MLQSRLMGMGSMVHASQFHKSESWRDGCPGKPEWILKRRKSELFSKVHPFNSRQTRVPDDGSQQYAPGRWLLEGRHAHRGQSESSPTKVVHNPMEGDAQVV
ncbi:hypothetical protein NDN08_006800 [Rhodosorus marinus]|uniref:Uncharacterized protein n=1 Tax=Rhodosorus marinus TaxID=101924 RepID=A0AAV8UIQ1_9RHOD|nr:hypothetical protein NDN08_006800 [Rhodosorus marinus]